MYSLMYLQTCKLDECCITHITAIWTLPSTYTLMYLQIISVTVSFITHITAICTFHGMYTLVLFHSTVLNKCSTEGSLLQRKKGSNINILKRNRKHYQNWVTNQLHKYYIARHVYFIKLLEHVVLYGVLTIHESNTPFPVTRHQYKMMCNKDILQPLFEDIT